MANKNISRLLEFQKLNNTRDLGGIRTRDGAAIQEGRLIRSGQLYFANAADLAKLDAMDIRRIYDFRSALERTEKPGPQIGQAENTHMPIVRDVTAGISRDKKSDSAAFDVVIQNVRDDPAFGIRYMEDTYVKMVSDPYAVAQYARFVKGVLELPEGAVLWHCTAGKDRAGFAAVLLEELLGVARDDIMEDYLATNSYLEQEIDGIIHMLQGKMDIRGAEDAIKDFFGARAEYLEMVYRYVDEQYGSMDHFLADGLGIDEAAREQCKVRYLV